MMFAHRDYPPFDHRPLEPPRSRDSSRPSSVGREDRIPPILYPRDIPPRDLPPREFPPGMDMPPRDMPPRDMPPRDMPPRDMPPRDMPPRDFLPPRDMGLPPREAGGPLLPPREIPRIPSRDGTVPVPAIPSRNSNGRADSGDLSRSESNSNLNKVNSSSTFSLGI